MNNNKNMGMPIRNPETTTSNRRDVEKTCHKH
jgi:hypothetical protein